MDEDAGTAEPANGRASLPIGGTPGATHIPRATSSIVTRTHVPLDQFWKYDQSGTDLGTAWKETGFNDSAWPSSRGVLAREDNPSITPLTNTVLVLSNGANQRITGEWLRPSPTPSGSSNQLALHTESAEGASCSCRSSRGEKALTFQNSGGAYLRRLLRLWARAR